jgi:hypothetical protein
VRRRNAAVVDPEVAEERPSVVQADPLEEVRGGTFREFASATRGRSGPRNASSAFGMSPGARRTSSRMVAGVITPRSSASA